MPKPIIEGALHAIHPLINGLFAGGSNLIGTLVFYLVALSLFFAPIEDGNEVSESEERTLLI